MNKKCLKCGYERQPSDVAPEYECPRCGVVYEKAEQRQRATPGSARMRARKKSSNERFTLLVGICFTAAGIILFVLAYTRDTSLFGYGGFAVLLIGLPLIGVELKVKPDRRTGSWDQAGGGFGDDGADGGE